MNTDILDLGKAMVYNPSYPGVTLSSSSVGNFSGTEPPLDLTPVCKFEFFRFGPVGKTDHSTMGQIEGSEDIMS